MSQKDKNQKLLSAFKEGDEAAIKALIDSTAEFNAAEFCTRNTPLHHSTRNGDKESAEVLLAKGAYVNAVKEDQNTLLHGAAQNGN